MEERTICSALCGLCCGSARAATVTALGVCTMGRHSSVEWLMSCTFVHMTVYSCIPSSVQDPLTMQNFLVLTPDSVAYFFSRCSVLPNSVCKFLPGVGSSGDPTSGLSASAGVVPEVAKVWAKFIQVTWSAVSFFFFPDFLPLQQPWLSQIVSDHCAILGVK